MDLDRKLLEKISLLDDDTLRGAIGGVAAGMGLDPTLTAHYLSDMKKLRKTVSSLSDEDLLRLQDALGEEKTRDLTSLIRREMGGE